MAKFAEVVDRVISKSDVVLEILDARFIEDTRNERIERKIKAKNKVLIHVINKCDYADKRHLDKVKRSMENCVFVSATRHFGTSLLKQKIMMLAARKGIKKPVVGVIGYPNVGKSSLINALKGAGSARTSSEAGLTRGEQHIRASRNFLLIDTPGVMPKEKNVEEELVLLGAKNPNTIENPDIAAMKLVGMYPQLMEKKYGVEISKSPETALEIIALKLNLKKKGNLPDTERASRKILDDWVKGRMMR